MATVRRNVCVFGVADERLIVSISHYRVRLAWQHIEPFAVAERALRQAPFFAFFEHMVCRAADLQASSLHRSLGLRSVADIPGHVPGTFVGEGRPTTARTPVREPGEA